MLTKFVQIVAPFLYYQQVFSSIFLLLRFFSIYNWPKFYVNFSACCREGLIHVLPNLAGVGVSGIPQVGVQVGVQVGGSEQPNAQMAVT